MARKGQKPPRLNLRSQQPRRMNAANDDNAALPANEARSTKSKQSRSSLRRYNSARSGDHDPRTHLPARPVVDETSSLLSQEDGGYQNYTSTYKASRPRVSRNNSGYVTPKYRSKPSSWSLKLGSTLAPGWVEDGIRPAAQMDELKASQYSDERVWYDQYTSTDWVHDDIADNLRVQGLRNRKDFRGRLLVWLDGSQGWILAALVGCITACIAYFVDITETAFFDIKEGYCTTGFYISKSNCCLSEEDCPLWKSWGQAFKAYGTSRDLVDLFFYVIFGSFFASAACLLTLTTKTTVPSPLHLPMMDENLAADLSRPHREDYDREQQTPYTGETALSAQSATYQPPATVYYPAAGSGVAEVKVILSGFVVHGYLGLKTLVVKTVALVLAVASGLSLGKEGPFVHIATCVGNICCRLFYKYNHNDGKRREVLSASAAGGVAVAFGAPIGGVLFSLEEVSYYFPPKTLFRTFFCCIAAALSLKFLNPYGTGKIVLFQVRYDADWRIFELVIFVVMGVLGGALGALFIKASQWWARTFRKIPAVKKHPVVEVLLVALITGFMQFWNSYTRKSVSTLLLELASPCSSSVASGLCPKNVDQIKGVLGVLFMAFLIKGFLTIITFGLKLPAGIYIPTMTVGGLMGRMFGHIVQYFVLSYPHLAVFSSCPVKMGGPESCVTPGVYALVAAGATMCGVTRLSVTLVIILFELTGSLDHVLPFSLAVLVAKWTADALEPRSIYDMLTEMNSYPFLDNKTQPVFTGSLGDITPHIRRQRIIDVSTSPMVPATDLRSKLTYLHDIGELDGGLPIVRDRILVGIIPAPELEFALDKLDNEDETLCMMGATATFSPIGDDNEAQRTHDPSDFTPFIDTAPVALDAQSSLSLVYQCFVKLGLRYICVLQDGKYAGLLHKKAFVRYVRELEHDQRHGR